MKTKSGLILILILVCNLTIAQRVLRWPSRTQEKGDRALPLNYNTSVFNDFLWTTPNFNSVLLEKSNPDKGVYTHMWKNEKIRMYKPDENKMILELPNNQKIMAAKEATKGNSYFDINLLKLKRKEEMRWTSEWVTKSKLVPVTKTRQVLVTKTRKVPVTKTRQVEVRNTNFEGETYITYRTETYTEYETETYTDFETETYTENELQNVKELEWVWKEYWTYYYEIPDYNYYQFKISNNEDVIIYEVENDGVPTYYFQNPAYYSVMENSGNYWGTKEMKLLFIDRNSNGIIFEDEDQVLFNTWNPYKKESQYQSITNLMSNAWYTLGYLKDNMFLEFLPDLKNNELRVDYGNEEYIKERKTGVLYINNINGKHKVLLNGRRYRPKRRYKIQYGKYKLVIQEKGSLDYEKVFEINDNTKRVGFDYKCDHFAGIVEIKNITGTDWKVEIVSDDYEKMYFNESQFNVPVGRVKIRIYADNIIVEKEIEVTSCETYILNFKEELKKRV